MFDVDQVIFDIISKTYKLQLLRAYIPIIADQVCSFQLPYCYRCCFMATCVYKFP